MRGMTFFIALCGLSACLPFLNKPEIPDSGKTKLSALPTHYQGVPLIPTSLSVKEKRFYKNFPGQIAKFKAGPRAVIFRWMTKATRKIHPAGACLRGLGYNVEPQPLRRDRAGNLHGVSMATRGKQILLVKERLYDRVGNSWTDVSSWYWSAILGFSDGPWCAVTVMERTDQSPRPL